MKIRSKRLIAEGNFLALNELEYELDDGVVRKWESVSRCASSGAVVMICTLEPSGKLVLIRQYRPPANGLVIEFPAGLLEKGEPPVEAALRELAEETGYSGKVKKVMPPTYNSPGLTSETVYLALMTAPDTPEKDLVTNFDDSEEIETILVEKKDLTAYLDRAMGSGMRVDAKVLAYSAALSER